VEKLHRTCKACGGDRFATVKTVDGDGIKVKAYELYICEGCGVQWKVITKNFKGNGLWAE